MRKAVEARAPALVFHNISLESTDAIESVVALGKLRYRGAVQLMSARGAAVLEHVKGIGAQHKLQMMPVLKKPFETDTIVKIIQELKLGMPPAVAARLELDDCIKNKWIEFWYQPKIALRKKQLAGAEAYARVRHPQHGLVLAGAFTANASDSGDAQIIGAGARERTQDQRSFFEARGQSAARGQYSRAGACEDSHGRHREEAPSGQRKMARPDHRRSGGSNRHRPRACYRAVQETRAAQRAARDRQFRPRLLGDSPRSKNCRSRSSSSTEHSSPTAVPTRSMHRYARR